MAKRNWLLHLFDFTICGSHKSNYGGFELRERAQKEIILPDLSRNSDWYTDISMAYGWNAVEKLILIRISTCNLIKRAEVCSMPPWNLATKARKASYDTGTSRRFPPFPTINAPSELPVTMPLERKGKTDQMNERYSPYSVDETKGRPVVVVGHNLPLGA